MTEDDMPSEGPHLDLTGEMSYGDYLDLDHLLAAQHPLSANHNEMLFIIQHQTTELWMKLIIHELAAAREAVKTDQLPEAFKMLARVSRIWDQLISAWNVLATLTPSEYLKFRDDLGKSSGLQSYQYRMIEFMLGNKNPMLVKPQAHHPDRYRLVTEQLALPSLYDEAARLLARNGFPLDAECVERDWTQPYRYNSSLERAWASVYRDTERHWNLYELAEKLVDIEDYLRQWRFRHVTTVERVIGFRRGTGGTAGVSYLKKMLEIELFPELWRVRTAL